MADLLTYQGERCTPRVVYALERARRAERDRQRAVAHAAVLAECRAQLDRVAPAKTISGAPKGQPHPYARTKGAAQCLKTLGAATRAVLGAAKAQDGASGQQCATPECDRVVTGRGSRCNPCYKRRHRARQAAGLARPHAGRGRRP